MGRFCSRYCRSAANALFGAAVVTSAAAILVGTAILESHLVIQPPPCTPLIRGSYLSQSALSGNHRRFIPLPYRSNGPPANTGSFVLSLQSLVAGEECGRRECRRRLEVKMTEQSKAFAKKDTFAAIVIGALDPPPAVPRLHVTGQVEYPTAGLTASLVRADPQGTNPDILILDVQDTQDANGAITQGVIYDEVPPPDVLQITVRSAAPEFTFNIRW
jgi:hypothetical protein